MNDSTARRVSQAHPPLQRQATAALVLGAIGIVFGDIGTSPLYALQTAFSPEHGIPLRADNVMGILSLIVWSMLWVITLKYLFVMMRADNNGEGGILALLALALRETQGKPRLKWTVIGIGIFGAAMFYGDSMITPAVTVLGAMEGLEVATPVFSPFVIPLSIGVIAALFLIQSHGTARIGSFFGPVMVLWFLTIGALGVLELVKNPAVLAALKPAYAVDFLFAYPLAGFLVLGAVFLALTGGEALYADMGHFGKRAIRIGWLALVFPALLLNYFGQAAFVLANPEAIKNPFYLMVPEWGRYPMVVLATAAAMIASQAVISGAFSVTRQAIQLGYMPRLDVEHTSAREMGQIYVPQVNWGLMICTIAIVIVFGSSSRLSAAYGMGVAMAMIITTILLHVVMTERWQWPTPLAYSVTALFAAIDVSFFGANLLKLPQGGWVSLFIALLLFTAMTTWKTGRRLVAERLTARAFPLEDFVSAVAATPPTRVPGTAVFMTAQPRGTPPALAHNLRYNKILHEHVVVLTVTTAPVPYVAPKDQITVQAYGYGIFNVRAQYGFMQDPHVPEALGVARDKGVELDPEDMIYFLGRETIIVTERAGMAMWREKLFVLMARNAVRATAFFRLPPERVVELGVQVEM